MHTTPEKRLFRVLVLRRILAVAVLLVGLVVLVSIVLNMMIANNRALRVRHQTEKLAQMMERIELDFADISHAQATVLTAQSFEQLVYMYDDLDWYSRYMLRIQLQRQLYELVQGRRFATSAYLHIPSLNITISGTRAKADAPDWLRLDAPMGIHLAYADGQLTNTLSYYRNIASDTPPLAILGVSIDLDRLWEDLNYIRGDERDLLYIRWNGTLGGLAPEGLPEGGETYALGGQTYEVLTVDGKAEPWTVYYLLARNDTDAFLRQMILMMWLFVGAMVIFEIISLLSWYRRVYKPLHLLLIEAFGKAEQGDLSYRINAGSTSPFAPVYENYNRMMEQMETYVERDLKQQILVGRANLKQLQAQINPHFMYNSYYVLYRLIKRGDMDNSVQLAEHLGQFYHYITRNADDEKRLADEVSHARVYAFIQQFRFRDNLAVEIDTPPEDLAEVYVPRLILQPVLENAFHYAYETASDAGPMTLRVRYEWVADGLFHIIVENSGKIDQAKIDEIQARIDDTSEHAETTALVNIHRRLRIYFGERGMLLVSASPLGGLCVRMQIVA